jgi:succinoglycan biosynthesis transport protein ExoP
MNAPNFNFDAEGRSDRLPSTAANGSRSITRESPEALVDFDTQKFDSQKFDSQDESASDFRKLFFTYLGLALKYRWLILTFCGLALAIGFIVTFTSTPLYNAMVTIQIDRQAQKVVKFEGAPDRDFGGEDLRFYQTQFDLLKSRSLAERVASDLDLTAASDFLYPPSTTAWEKLRSLIFLSANTANTANTATKDQGNFEQRKAAAAGMVQGGLLVAPVPQSSLVRISFTSPSPAWAQRIANGVAESYASSNLERRYSATAYARNFLKERLEELKLKLEESEKALVAYADEKELIDLSSTASGPQSAGRQSLADSDLAALNAALQKVVTERIHAQELWQQANDSKGIGLPQLLDDSAIKTLNQQRAVLMVDYQNKLSTFKPAYPDMQRLKAQIDQIGQEIKSAADVIKQSLKARYESALQQEVLLKTKMDETKRGVLNTRNKEIQYNILKRESDTNRTLYDGLLQQYKDAGVAGAVGTNNIAIIDRAQLPGGPFKPDLRSNLLISLMLGLVAAALAIALFEILDDTFKSPEEIEEQLGLAVLGIIPFSKGDILTEITGPSSPVGEAFRSFRTALQFSTDQGAPKSILVTSAQPGEGKSTTALALAVNLAQLGMRVLLIDADLRNPSQHHNLKRNNGPGLANYLAGLATPESIFQKTNVDGLYFMSSGPIPPNPAELLAGPKMMSLLSVASEKVDTVIIDSPPVMGLADAPLLASMASGTLLVIGTAETRRGVVKAALKRLHFARARMAGAVMNKCDFRTSYGYGYGYGSGYTALEYYGYGQKNKPAQVEHSPRG